MKITFIIGGLQFYIIFKSSKNLEIESDIIYIAYSTLFIISYYLKQVMCIYCFKLINKIKIS